MENQKLTIPDPISNYISLIENKIPDMIPGDFAEFGCYNGGHVARLAALDGRPTWAFDTFEGMPAEDYNGTEDACNPPGKFKPDHDVLAALAQIPNIKVVKGRFADTLPLIPAGTVFACVYIDCDYYFSHKQVLDYLRDNKHILPGTLIVFDDYDHLPGAKRAIDEFRGSIPLDSTNKYLIYA